MVGTIRRPLDDPSRQPSGPPPPSYDQAARSPVQGRPPSAPYGGGAPGGVPQGYPQDPRSGTVRAGAFARAPSSGSSRPISTPDMAGHRPLSQANMPGSRPQSMAPQSQYQNQGRPVQQNPLPAPGSAGLARSNTQEDRLAVLRRYDTVILIDDSASMGNLWYEAEGALAGIVQQVIRFDQDGIDCHFLNSTHHLLGVKDPMQIRELFQSVGPVGESTPTEVKVEELLSAYVEQCERAKASGQPMPKPMNLICLTDGEADDPDTLAYALTGFAQRMDDIRAPLSQLGVQFVQIGSDPAATEALKQLDDDLQGCRDMVDTTPYQGKLTDDFIIKVTLGSINRRIDRSG